MNTKPLQTFPLDSPIGAKVTGVNLTEIPEPSLVDALELALEQFGVLIFESQQITPLQQIEFSRALGELETGNTVSVSPDDFPELAEVGNQGRRPVSFAPVKPDGELEWHTDHIQHKVPSKSTLLYAKEVPPEGGDTLFACMYAAYDALNEKEQSHCDQAIALHSASGLRRYLARQGEFDIKQFEARDDKNPTRWPLVRRHPLTGRKALYFAAAVTVGIEGWPEAEALAFIQKLTTHATQTPFVYRHQWEVNQPVLWDNRRVLHTGTWYDKNRYRRYLLRTMMRENLEVEG